MQRCFKFSLILSLLFSLDVSAETISYSEFAFLIEKNGYFRDSTVIEGPVHSNGFLFISSSTPGRDNDPWFYTVSTPQDSFYTLVPDIGYVSATVPHPPGSNLWIEPYELMCQGPPWFNLGVDSIPFGPDNINWQDTYLVACEHGCVLNDLEDGTRVILEEDNLHYRETFDGPVSSICISDLEEPVIWFENTGDDLYIRSIPPDSGFGLTVPVTIGCYGDVYVMGDILYEPFSDGMLGLVSVFGDFIIADIPQYEPWEGMWAIETEKDMTCSGSFLITSGRFLAENPWDPSPAVDFILIGSMQVFDEYITAYVGPTTWGYFIKFDYDQRLFTESPPFYPSYDAGVWIEDDPELSSDAELIINVRGNPFHESLVLSLSDDVNTEVSIFIMDVSGRLVFEGSIFDELSIPSYDLPSGTYILFAETASGLRQSQKIVKI